MYHTWILREWWFVGRIHSKFTKKSPKLRLGCLGDKSPAPWICNYTGTGFHHGVHQNTWNFPMNSRKFETHGSPEFSSVQHCFFGKVQVKIICTWWLTSRVLVISFVHISLTLWRVNGGSRSCHGSIDAAKLAMASATMNQNLLDQEAPLIEEVRNSTQQKTDSQNNSVVAVSIFFGFIYIYIF